MAAFAFDTLYTLSINSESVRGSIAHGSHPAALIVLSLIALFLLTLSCFNYINIAIATAARRLKEIGVRKVMGSSKKQLVGQFLTENMLLCALALILGIVAARFFLLPAWNSMFNFFGDEMGLSFAASPGLWVFLVALLGLIMASQATDPMIYYVGLGLCLFGVLFNYGLVARNSGKQPE